MNINYIINRIKKRAINFYNYRIKKFFYIYHFSKKKLNFDWEKTNHLRIKVINNLINKTQKKRYLEIGCDLNQVFDKIYANKKVGVDPERGGNIRSTSDVFFKSNSEIFDVIFIDGLHEYEQIRKDVINSLKFLDKNGYIILHDLLPRTWLEEHVPRLTSTWCGDVWKISFDLKKTQGLNFDLLLVDFGLGIISKKINNIELLSENHDGKKFNYLVDNYHKLPILEQKNCNKYI